MNVAFARAVWGTLLVMLAAPSLAQTPSPESAKRSAPQAASKKPVPPRTAAKPAAAPVVLPDPPTPVQQASQLGLTPCVGLIDRMARAALTSQYDVQSGWNKEDPSRHVFQSIAVLNRPENTPPDGLAALIATPTPGGSCDGVSVQIFPLAGSCPDAQQALMTNGETAAPILNAKILFGKNGKRIFLLPGFARTCIAISVDSSFGEAPSPN